MYSHPFPIPRESGVDKFKDFDSLFAQDYEVSGGRLVQWLVAVLR